MDEEIEAAGGRACAPTRRASRATSRRCAARWTGRWGPARSARGGRSRRALLAIGADAASWGSTICKRVALAALGEIAAEAVQGGHRRDPGRRRGRAGSGRGAGAGWSRGAAGAGDRRAGVAGARLSGRRARARAVRADRERAGRGRRGGGGARGAGGDHGQCAGPARRPAALARSSRQVARAVRAALDGRRVDGLAGLPSGGRCRRPTSISRFDPRFWTVNFPRPMMAAVTTTAPDALRVDAVFYRAGRSGGADLGGGGPARPSAAAL